MVRLVKIYLNCLLLNSIREDYGESPETEIETSRKIALKRIAKPNFKHSKIFREDLVGIHMAKPVLVMNRPIQVGYHSRPFKISHV